MGVRLFFGSVILAICVLAAPAQASFPGDDGPIAFSESNDGSCYAGSDIWLRNPDGTHEINLTKTPDLCERTPSFSADGEQIAYSAVSGGGKADVWIIHADGSRPHNVSNDPDATDRDPVFSPDGLLIYFSSDRDGDFDIWRMDASGANPVNLTPGSSTQDRQPAISPDGTTIDYVAGTTRVSGPSEYEAGRDLWEMSAAGEGAELLVDNEDPVFSPYGEIPSSRVDLQSPDFAPDGGTILFSIEGGDYGHAMGVLRAGDPGPIATQLGCGGSEECEPSWSPDGESVAAVYRDRDWHPGGDQRAQIEILEFARLFEPGFSTGHAGGGAKAPKRLASGLPSEFSPSWGVASERLPQTTIDAGPAHGERSGHHPKFKFSSTSRGATFECQLRYGADLEATSLEWKRCSTPDRFRKSVPAGEAVFRVRAVVGVRSDPTPAEARFTVGR